MKRTLLFLAVIMMTSCVNVNYNGSPLGKTIKGNGILKEKERGRMDFHAIDVRGSMDVIIVDNADAPIIVSGDENLIDSIETIVKDGVLNIKFRSNLVYSSKNGLKVKVPANGKINNIKASGSSDVTVEGTVIADNLTVSCSGSSDFKGNIKASTCKINMSGSSDFRGKIEAKESSFDCKGSSDCIISGSSDICNISMSGSSDFKGYDFVVNKLICKAEGSSDIQITCNEEISVNASGSSDVYYRGSAKVIEKKLSGSSDLRNR